MRTKNPNHRLISLIAALAFLLAAGLGGARSDSERPGDFNRNGRIDSDDLFDFGHYFGLNATEPLFQAEGFEADFDTNGVVDEIDLFYFASHWHQK